MAVDVVFNIVLLKERQVIASPAIVSQFGQQVDIEHDGILRVSAIAEAPDADGYSYTKVIMSVFDGMLWLPAEEMSMTAYLSKTPSFQYSVPGTSFRFVIMPRRVVASVPRA
jgi:hypothetical protein